MLLERAEISIKDGSEDAFISAMRTRGIALLSAVPGVKSVRMGRGVESPGKFMLLVHWESLAAHGEFNKTPSSTELRDLIRPHSKGGSMEHFEMD